MLDKPIFTIVVVCLNPGDKLKMTIDSVCRQMLADWEIVVKDGGSADGSVEALEKAGLDQRIRIFRQPDKGIYDAMNQAVEKACGRFVYFLNCGDLFFDNQVLARFRQEMERGLDQDYSNENSRSEKSSSGDSEKQLHIYYGNILEKLTGQQVASNPRLDGFGYYRNVPCHQACFYERELLVRHPFEIRYKVRADYEQFLWCALAERARLIFIPTTVAYYEGGGFSETKENRKLSAKEHQEITAKYMSRGEIWKYKIILWLTLAPLRTVLAENKITAHFYQGIKKAVYQIRAGK